MRVRQAGVTLAVVGGVVLGVSGTAAATEAQFTRTYTAANGGLGCAGWVDARVIAGPDQFVPAGSAAVFLRPAFYGIDATSSASCTLGATVTWRNLDSGTTGTTGWAVLFSSNGQSLGEARLDVPSGPGRVSATVNTNAIHYAGTAEFVVG